MSSFSITSGPVLDLANAPDAAESSKVSPPGHVAPRTLSLSDFKDFHGLLWKQSPNCLRLYTHQLRYISLWQGKLVWSLPDKSGTAEEYRGCVDFARNPSIAEPMEGSSTRFSVRPVNGVWQSAKFTGADSGRWLCFDAAGCSYTREEWLEKINVHICYGRQQLTGSTTASLLAVAAGARLMTLAHKGQETNGSHAEAQASEETPEPAAGVTREVKPFVALPEVPAAAKNEEPPASAAKEAPVVSREVSPAKTPEPVTPDKPPKAASSATPDDGASTSAGGGNASEECTDKDVARAYLGGMLGAIGQALARRNSRPSSGRPSQENSPLVERSQQMAEASEVKIVPRVSRAFGEEALSPRKSLTPRQSST